MIGSVSTRKKKILLVEDSRLTARVLTDLLGENGYDTETIATGEEAVQKISCGMSPDLILMDIELAGKMNGIEAADKIAKIRDIPVVFLTAQTSEEIVNKIKKVKAYGFVLKNTDKAALLSTVEMALKLNQAISHASMFERIFESSLNEYYILHLKSMKFVAVNRVARENLGYTAEELRNMSPLDINEELNQRSFQKLINILINKEHEKIIFNTVHRRKDGTLYPVEVNMQLHNYDGEELCVALAADLTEREKLEEEKRYKEEQCRLMLEGIQSPAWLVSGERHILAQNRMAQSLFKTKVGEYCWENVLGGGHLADEYKNSSGSYSFPLPGTKCYFCRREEAFDKNQPVNCEVELSDKTWNVWWTPLSDNVFLHYAIDVTKYKRMEDELRHLSVTDYLTNTFNRRYFIKKLEEEIERSSRSGKEFSIILLDIDHFKSINDRFGHNVGDLVLKSLVEVIKGRISKIDILARWGGEEFVILLPDMSVKGAAFLAEELQRLIRQMDIPNIGRVAASFGVAAYCPGDSIDTLINKADNMMYEAKAAGGDCVRYMSSKE
ncbi:MAG TPA: diguanylate cyclase [Clostridiaceae bacterium]|nr:diguanylate cyclase [Clostridiaceae bacterium]